MDLTRLRYFATVAEELHFGRAADRLHMAQPPLSRQIRTLEAELGVSLFERTTRHVELTAAGRLILPDVRRLLSDVDALERRVDQFRRGDGGVLRLGFVDSSSYDVMPRFLRAYRTALPLVEYELRSMSSDEQHAALLAGEIDVGLGRSVGPEGLDAVEVLQEPLVLAVGADHAFAKRTAISLAELQQEAFVGFDRRASPSLHTELTGLFGERGITYDPIIEATEYTTVLGLVASGQGIAIVPSGVQTFQPSTLRFLPLNDEDAASTLLLLSRGNEQSPLVKRAVALVAEVFST